MYLHVIKHFQGLSTSLRLVESPPVEVDGPFMDSFVMRGIVQTRLLHLEPKKKSPMKTRLVFSAVFGNTCNGCLRRLGI